MEIVIINYGAGNSKSIQFALERLGQKAVLSDDFNTIKGADKVIFPGVGEASSAMAKLQASGLDTLIPTLKQPVLGICLGMQLMCMASEEGNTKGLGIFNAEVKKFTSEVKVPQIQWNALQRPKKELFEGISDGDFIYMVHSYYAPVTQDTVATCSYGIEYSAALSKRNFYGTQFHPEKSSSVGEQLLQNFINL